MAAVCAGSGYQTRGLKVIKEPMACGKEQVAHGAPGDTARHRILHGLPEEKRGQEEACML